MILWVSGVVCVTPHTPPVDWFTMLSVIKENGTGSAVGRLPTDPVPIDAAAVEPRWCAGLQPTQRVKPASASGLLAKPIGRRLTHTARRNLSRPDVNQAAQERTGGQHDCATAQVHAHPQGVTPATTTPSLNVESPSTSPSIDIQAGQCALNRAPAWPSR